MYRLATACCPPAFPAAWRSIGVAADKACGAMIIDATRRATAADPAIFALVVDANDDDAVSFHQHLHFRRSANRPMSLYLPIATALKAIEAANRSAATRQ